MAQLSFAANPASTMPAALSSQKQSGGFAANRHRNRDDAEVTTYASSRFLFAALVSSSSENASSEGNGIMSCINELFESNGIGVSFKN